METKRVQVHCANEHAVVGDIVIKEGVFVITTPLLISSFVPIDQGHRLNGASQKNGDFARCSCGGILSIKPDEVIYSENDIRKNIPNSSMREAARNASKKIAQSIDTVHRFIDNNSERGSTPIILGRTKIEVS